MVCWSTENATKAYITAMKMAKGAKEPDVAEFISALAAGTNAKLMVIASANAADSATLLALVAAAHQTGGRIICVLPGIDEIQSSREALGSNQNWVEFVVGSAQTLLIHDFKEADFVVIDCKLERSETILETAQKLAGARATVLGYNALSTGSWRYHQGLNGHFLPIGEGLLVTRKRSRWVVKVDECTGEEHVIRIRSSHLEC